MLLRQVMWLIKMPAGFKPNPNLDIFLGYLMLDIINVWNYVTTELNVIEPILIKYLGAIGFMGLSFQLSIGHDILFFCSTHILFLYSIFAAVYKYAILLMGTMIRLFSGKKLNVLRGGRVD